MICDDEVASRGEGAWVGTPPSVLEERGRNVNVKHSYAVLYGNI